MKGVAPVAVRQAMLMPRRWVRLTGESAEAAPRLSGAARMGVDSNARILLDELLELALNKNWIAVVEELLRLIDGEI